jgi:hypothetical protein
MCSLLVLQWTAGFIVIEGGRETLSRRLVEEDLETLCGFYWSIAQISKATRFVKRRRKADGVRIHVVQSPM